MQLPRSVREIDAGWLTEALREGGLAEASVQTVRTEAIGEGAGFAGELARLTVAYGPAATEGPRTMIAKVPTQVPEARALFVAAGIYAAEGSFYRDLASMVPIRTPRCYFNGMDVQSGDFVLLLEDLAPARVGDQIRSCTRAEAEMIVHQLARLHARFWADPQLDALAWLASLRDARKDLTPLYPFIWPLTKERVGDLLTPKVVDIAASLAQHLPRVAKLLATPPMTLTHGDYRLDNMLFEVGEPPGEFAVIDWQAVAGMRGVADLAYFMTGSLTTEDRRAWGDDLVAFYMARLEDGGVRGYSMAECRRDFALALLQQLSVSVLLMSGADLSVEGRGTELAKAMLQRTNAIFEDTDVDEALKE